MVMNLALLLGQLATSPAMAEQDDEDCLQELHLHLHVGKGDKFTRQYHRRGKRGKQRLVEELAKQVYRKIGDDFNVAVRVTHQAYDTLLIDPNDGVFDIVYAGNYSYRIKGFGGKTYLLHATAGSGGGNARTTHEIAWLDDRYRRRNLMEHQAWVLVHETGHLLGLRDTPGTGYYKDQPNNTDIMHHLIVPVAHNPDMERYFTSKEKERIKEVFCLD